MSDTSNVAVSREYLEAKRAYEESTQDLMARLNAVGKEQASRLVRGAAPKVLNLTRVDYMRLNLHVQKFARYLSAYLLYYGDLADAPVGGARKALGLAGEAQKLSVPYIDRDLQRAAGYLIEDWCDKAMRAYRRYPSQENAKQLFISAVQIQALNWQMPALDAVMREAAARWGN